jgi:hypothetical protein
VPSQQLLGQLQAQPSVDRGNYIMDKHNIKSKIKYRKLLEETHLARSLLPDLIASNVKIAIQKWKKRKS